MALNISRTWRRARRKLGVKTKRAARALLTSLNKSANAAMAAAGVVLFAVVVTLVLFASGGLSVLWAILGFFLVFVLVAAVIGGIAYFSRDPTGRGTGGRGAYFANLRQRLPSIPAPGQIVVSFWSDMGKLALALLLVQFVLSWVGLVSWWAMILYLPLLAVIALRESTTKPGIRRALTVMAVIGFAAVGLSHIPWFKPCDEACQAQKVEQVRLERERVAKERLALEEIRNKPIVDSACPGVAPTEPIPISTDWIDINPRGCATTYTLVDTAGKVMSDDAAEFDPPYGVPRRVRLKSGTGGIYVMHCPAGTGSVKSGQWRCPSKTDIGTSFGIQLGFYTR